MNGVYLGIGGNEGNRARYLEQAREAIATKIGAIQKQSSVYQTAAWGNTQQQDFFNQVLYVKTALDAETVLEKCLEIEVFLGRRREIKWSARTIDIDILFFNQIVIHKKQLKIPHPYAHERNFVLVPMNEIAPHYIHPLLRRKISTLLRLSPDTLPVSLAE